MAPLGATKVNALANVADRLCDVTTTSAAPAVGVDPTTAMRTVELWRTTFVATTPPTVTTASLPKSVPFTVMFVPPVVLPCDGEIELMAKTGAEGPVTDFAHALATRARVVSRAVWIGRYRRGEIRPNKRTVMLLRALMRPVRYHRVLMVY